GVVVASLIVAIPFMVLQGRIQPVAESARYGRIFGFLIVLGAALAILSFQRFLTLWWFLQKLLGRLAASRFSAAFGRLSSVVSWKPMKAFGWQPPASNLVQLSADRLAALVQRGALALPGDGADPARLLERFLGPAGAYDSADQVAARFALQRL